ncbi:uncharacterized protein CXQ87_000542 [Candidozyma duobushaemuli]|uniref:Uncharacterized protein n=2 Tax=Candidozyma TaxID=3303203 RepID=A0ABX8HZP0_9ASCO|nr:uncharacterized protein CXQ87_000542 [[Candida] duobushaemulonis]PVH17649.1 hypothetical protein CXQ87_000542 [[Candida] duobushaemulonis]QWU86265.1 hypothetical protein CA3LBN_000483 [[Candida] haemuloni]
MSRLVTLRYNSDKWHEAQLNRGSDSSAQNSPSKMITLNYRKERSSTPTPAVSPVPWLFKKREEKARRPKYDENEPFLVRPAAESLARLRNYESFIDPEDPLQADKNWYHDLTNVAQRLKLLRDTYKVLQAVRKKRAMGERVDFRTAHELKSKTGSPVHSDDDREKNSEEEKPPPPPPARRGRPRKRGGGVRGRKPGPRSRAAIPAPGPTATRSRGRRREADKVEERKMASDSASTPAPSEGFSHDESSLTTVGLASSSQPLASNEIMVPELMPRLAAKQAGQDVGANWAPGPGDSQTDQDLMSGLGQELGQRLTQELTQASFPDPGSQDQVSQDQFANSSQAPSYAQWSEWQNNPVNQGIQLDEYLAHGYAEPSSLSESTVSIIENLKRRNPSGSVLASLYNRPGGLNFSPQWAAQNNYQGDEHQPQQDPPSDLQGPQPPSGPQTQ